MQVKDDKVDAMLTKLLEVRGKKPGKNINLSEDDLKYLCAQVREIFISQPNLLELEAPLKVCGKYTHSFNNHYKEWQDGTHNLYKIIKMIMVMGS